MYGCPTTLNGSPIGGGVGYTNTFTSGQAQYIVSTEAQLADALSKATSGQMIYVADSASITITKMWYGSEHALFLPNGVTLAGGRGRSGITGGTIKLSTSLSPSSFWYMFKTGSNCKIGGINFNGQQPTNSSGYNWGGIWCGNNIEVFNNEIQGFGYAGTTLWQNLSGWFHHNNIHNCQGAGHGYGVETGAIDIYHTCSAIVEGNLFDYCRHCIAGQNGRIDYTFRYNLLGNHASWDGNQIDMHGPNDGGDHDLDKDGADYIYCAGNRLQIYNNTTTCQNLSPWFVAVRGVPYSKGLVSVHHNWLKNNGYAKSHIAQLMFRMPEYGYNAYEGSTQPFVRMESYSNWFGTSTPPSDLKQFKVTTKVTLL